MSIRLNAPKGQKVRYRNKDGFETDRLHANKFLNTEDIYTIKETLVYSSNSSLYLEEFPDEKFNLVMFEEVEPILEEVETSKEIYERLYKTRWINQ